MPLLHIGGYEWLDWDLHLDVVALCLLLLGSYLYAVTVLRRRVSGAERVSRGQVVAFTLGVLIIYAAAGSPLHGLADTYLVSAHMLQHILLMLVAAPLLLAGVPAWMWRELLRLPGAMAVGRVLSNGLVALVVFNVVLLLVHLPSAVDLQVREGWFHLFVHVTLVGAGLVMWWPVLSPLPELPPLSYPVQMVYLFLLSLLPSVMASFVTFSDRVVYPVYAEAPRIWGLTPVTDQQIAGGMMKLVGSLIFWSFMVVAFFKWFAQAEGEARGQRWEDIEEEPGRLGLQ